MFVVLLPLWGGEDPWPATTKFHMTMTMIRQISEITTAKLVEFLFSMCPESLTGIVQFVKSVLG